MEVARLRGFLRTHRRVALDACIFIYQWEANPRYSPLTDAIFYSLEQCHFVAVTSMITMTELLVHPYRKLDVLSVEEMISVLSTYPNLEWIAPHLEIAARAAKMRAQFGFETPDAMQCATAVLANATALLTNDPVFKRVPELDVMVLDNYL